MGSSSNYLEIIMLITLSVYLIFSIILFCLGLYHDIVILQNYKFKLGDLIFLIIMSFIPICNLVFMCYVLVGIDIANILLYEYKPKKDK